MFIPTIVLSFLLSLFSSIAKQMFGFFFLCVASMQMPAYRLLNNASDESIDAPHNQTLLGRHMSRTGTPHITPVQMPDFHRHPIQDESMHDQHNTQTAAHDTTDITREGMQDAYSQQHTTMPTYSHQSSPQVTGTNAHFGDLFSVPPILQQNSSLTCGCLIGIMILLFIITVLLFFIAIRISNQ